MFAIFELLLRYSLFCFGFSFFLSFILYFLCLLACFVSRWLRCVQFNASKKRTLSHESGAKLACQTRAENKTQTQSRKSCKQFATEFDLSLQFAVCSSQFAACKARN